MLGEYVKLMRKGAHANNQLAIWDNAKDEEKKRRKNEQNKKKRMYISIETESNSYTHKHTSD